MPAGLRIVLAAASIVAASIAGAGTAAAQAGGQVVVYRCVDDAGNVALRDTPCPKGERQETRTLARPSEAAGTQAPATGATGATGTTAAPESPSPPRVVIVREAAPPPMYECTTPDNTTYTSDSPEGNPRWVPMWTLGWPTPAGTWVRDACRALPQAETCARLRDRRAEIERRFFNAMPSERARLETEERGLDARLDADCAER
jgi:hypothetical protein